MSSCPSAEAASRATVGPLSAKTELAARAEEIEAAGTYHPTEAERAGIDRGLADAQAGRFATAKQVAAVFARHRRA